MTSDAITVYLVRHGATEDFEARRLQGQRRDGGLSALGVGQIERLADRLRGIPLAAIYTSDLARAVETARILQSALPAPLRPDPRLRELDFGAWEGMTRAELEAANPHDMISPYGIPHPVARYGGEPITSLRRRVAEAYASIIDAHARQSPQNVLVVAHAHSLSMLLCVALDLPIREQWYFGIDPGSISTLLVPTSGRSSAFLSQLNQV